MGDEKLNGDVFFKTDKDIIDYLKVSEDKIEVIYQGCHQAFKEQQTAEFNLNRPAVIETLIRHYKNQGWNPKKAINPFIDDKALKILEIISFPKENDQL